MRISRSALAAIRPSGDVWEMAGLDAGKVPEEGSLWVYRRTLLRARIRPSVGTRPFDPASASVAFRVTWKVQEAVSPRSPPHQSRDWLAASGFEGLSVPLVYSPDATCHEAKVPVVAGAGIRAAAPGWRPAALLLPSSFGASAATDVELVLRPTLRVAGRVITGDGSPPGPVLVSAYTAIRTDWEGLRTVLLLGGAGGLTAAATPGGRAEAAFRKSVTVDPAGRFSVEIEAEGETTLVIWDPGFAPLFHPLGTPGESLEGVDLELRPPDGQGGIRILCGGKPLPHHLLFLSDLTARIFQPAVQIPIGPEGKVLARWFGRGREYGLGIEGPLKDGPMREALRDRFLTWNGQDEIEWTDLPLASEVLSR
jgi:hypothetical protein